MQRLSVGVVLVKFQGVTCSNKFYYFVNLRDEPDAQEKTIWVADLRARLCCESCHMFLELFLMPITAGDGEDTLFVNS